MRRKFFYMAAVLAICSGTVLASPANSIEHERHERRLFYWVFGPGILYPYITPGFYCPVSDVKNHCLFYGSEWDEVLRRGREAVGAEVLADK